MHRQEIRSMTRRSTPDLIFFTEICLHDKEIHQVNIIVSQDEIPSPCDGI